jgi:hypothetical protein
MLAMGPTKAVPAVRFEATTYAIDGSTILRLPENASTQLPSRGQVAVQATVNGHACQTVAEPDGESGHWWVNATRNPGTRQRRVEVGISKLQSGKRRPCCFNLAACTDPDLSKNGKLITPR